MAPLKSALAMSLRSQLKPASRSVTKSASRCMTATSNNSAPLVHSRPNPTSSEMAKDFHFPTYFAHSISKGTQQVSAKQPQNPFTELLNSITNTLVTTSRPSLPLLHNILGSYVSDRSHWSRYAHANREKQYTRNLVCSVPGVFNLLLLVWTPGQKSPIHDHADAHCLMKILKGEIQENRYATPSRPGKQGPLVHTSCQNFGLNKVTYMADQLGLHSIGNPHPTEYAASLHLYTPPNAAIRGCNVFDERNGEARHVSQCNYDSVEGELTPAY